MESRLLYLRHVDNARKEEGTERRERWRKRRCAPELGRQRSAAQHGIESEREKAPCAVVVAVKV